MEYIRKSRKKQKEKKSIMYYYSLNCFISQNMSTRYTFWTMQNVRLSLPKWNTKLPFVPVMTLLQPFTRKFINFENASKVARGLDTSEPQTKWIQTNARLNKTAISFMSWYKLIFIFYFVTNLYVKNYKISLKPIVGD